MSDVAMILVAAPHMCNFVWLLFFRSSHGILFAFGSSLALEAALLWFFLSHQGTSRRIMFQTLGLGLVGVWLVLRTLIEYFRTRASYIHQAGSGTAMGSTEFPGGRGIQEEADYGGAQKDEGERIIGAERWLIAWRCVPYFAFCANVFLPFCCLCCSTT